jgi:hypothetical protein
MNEMIVCVAKAICKAQTQTEEFHQAFFPEAVAAIEAMRAPNRKMILAAAKAMSPGRRPTQQYVSCNAKHGIRYRAMIDEALKHGEAE